MTFFPASSYSSAGRFAEDYFEHLAQFSRSMDWDAMSKAGDIMLTAALERRTVFSCGNGGSAAIANHLACDCMKGVQAGTALKPRVQSLSANVELLTAIANDFGVQHIFAFQLGTLATAGDVLVAISSSGESPNIVAAIEQAKDVGMKTIAITGFSGGKSAKLADVSLYVSAENYGIVEDIHQSTMHILAQYVRQRQLIDPDTLGSVKF